MMIEDEISVDCRNCGKPLGLLPSRAKHKTFCSRECREEWHSRRTTEARRLLRELEGEEALTGKMRARAGGRS